MEQSIKMKELLSGVGIGKNAVETINAFEELPKREVSKPIVSSTVELQVKHINVEPIQLQEINDTYGRLSDIIEAVEHSTGLSVIPLEMANIAPEVASFNRHDIFTFHNKRFAMSRVPRENVMDAYQEKIIQTLESGVVFREDITTNVKYKDKEYLTLKLSATEWTFLLSKFCRYKQSLRIVDDNSIIMEIFAERV